MTTLFKNLFLKQNFSILKSNALNNNSTWNYCTTSENVENLNTKENIPINSNNNYLDEIILSPLQKKSYKNHFINNKSNLFHKIDKIEKITTLESSKSYNDINQIKLINIKRMPNNKRNIKFIPKQIPISKTIKEKEKHPQDSKKKKKLKNSISSRAFRTIKIPDYKNYESNKNNFPRNSISKKNKIPLNSKIICLKPKERLNLKEFDFGEQIGNGTFGEIYSVKWVKNNKHYAMKKEILYNIKDIEKRRNIYKIIKNFIKATNNKGIINLYGNLYFQNNKIINNSEDKTNNKIIQKQYIYYQLMEKAERDWDKEINIRREHKLYYTESELIDIMTQLIKTLSLLQKHHITHRDIKPQNILVSNGKYKLCDFGEIRVLERDGVIVQRVRGSELFMSPILFQGLHLDLIQVRHNTYKSDVFSLGMCLFYAASLTYSGVDSIREINDMNKIENILMSFLYWKYSEKVIRFIILMLEIDESKRLNFIQLEEKLKYFI